MLCSLVAAHTVAALVTAGGPGTAVRDAGRIAAADSIAEAAVVAEIRAFYRDLDAQHWAPLLNHFIPAKVTARWAPPAASAAWAGLAAPGPVAAGVAGSCEPRAAMAIIGDWARVRVRRCATPPDEAWLLRVSGRWKIVYLDLAGPPLALSAAP